MPPPDLKEPRRRPRRTHGRAVFDAILEATSQLLERGSTLTTTQISDRAGISVGSLYGYFDDKWAILAELLRAKESRTLREVKGLVLGIEDLALPDAIEALVTRALDEAQRNVPLNRVVPAAWIRLARSERERVVRRLMADHLEDRLGLDSEEARQRAFVIFHSVDAVVRAAAHEEQHLLKDRLFRQRIVEFVLAMALRGDHAAGER